MDTQEWAARTEIIASLAVVVSLGFVVYEVRQNTAAIERQSSIEREARMQAPYLTSSEFRDIYAVVKSTDGAEPVVAAFMERYGLGMNDAVYWVRHLEQIWMGLEADFEYLGRTEETSALIDGLLQFPDNRLYWDSYGRSGRHGPAFVDYVEDVTSPRRRTE